MSASDLDASETYARLDPHGLYARIAALPEQIEQSAEAAAALSLPGAYTAVDSVVIAGMGGSGIGGALLQALAVDAGGRIPISVVRGYALPAWVGERTLVIASSNSGNTEETVSAFEAALRAGAKSLAITTGGRLLELARQHDVPTLSFGWEGEPRSALGWSFAAPLAMCARLGLVPDLRPDLASALDAMRPMRD